MVCMVAGPVSWGTLGVCVDQLGNHFSPRMACAVADPRDDVAKYYVKGAIDTIQFHCQNKMRLLLLL